MCIFFDFYTQQKKKNLNRKKVFYTQPKPTKQNKTKQNKTKQNKTKQNKMSQTNNNHEEYADADMVEFVKTVYSVYVALNATANDTLNYRQKGISILILRYVSNLASQYNFDLQTIATATAESNSINMSPFFKYIDFKHIKLLNFDTIGLEDIDVNNPDDIEKFVLSHIACLSKG